MNLSTLFDLIPGSHRLTANDLFLIHDNFPCFALIDDAQGKLEELIRLGLVDLTLQEVLCATSHWLRHRSDQGKPTPETNVWSIP